MQQQAWAELGQAQLPVTSYPLPSGLLAYAVATSSLKVFLN